MASLALSEFDSFDEDICSGSELGLSSVGDEVHVMDWQRRIHCHPPYGHARGKLAGITNSAL